MEPAALSIVTMTLGPVQTNSYLVADPEARVAAVIDPAWDGAAIVREAEQRGWQITDLWLTHAHFDHFGGAGGVADGVDPAPARRPAPARPAHVALEWRRGMVRHSRV